MKKVNKKGFTLIELLAVIVILGLLMAIAIPSVTKYITQSRKKTLVSTINQYISSVTTEVNDATFAFTGNNTIYALPIECVTLERGGTNPFGLWYPASSANWAYVLVQYDSNNSSYTYGFTFKDSSGYGLNPVAVNKLDAKGSQVVSGTGLEFDKLDDGYAAAYSMSWSGFNVVLEDKDDTEVDERTKLVVLKSEKGATNSEHVTTGLCALAQE